MPALAAIKAAYQAAELCLLGSSWHARFLPGRGVVDRVIVVPPSEGVRDDAPPAPAPELESFFAAMRAEQFDIAFQLHGGGRYSNPFVQRLGAKMTIGLQDDDAPPLDRSLPYIYYQNEYARYLEVVALAGAAPVTLKPELPLLASDIEEARQVLGGLERPIAVLNPNATDPRRVWPAARFATVGDWLAERGYAVAITGGPGEEPRATAVESHMRSPAKNLAGRLSLNGLAGLLGLADVAVSNDSGPLHLATAVGTPAVGLYWCGNMMTCTPLGRRLQRVETSWQTVCPHCGENIAVFRKRRPSDGGCDHDACFVDSIAVDQVIGTLSRLLREFPPGWRTSAREEALAR